MGMRMMFTMFVLVVLATTVVSFPLDHASNGRDAAAYDKATPLIARDMEECCSHPACQGINPDYCD
uniref:A superfamily conotoxin Rt1.1 n=2 Tax=Conus TaxID=6490 RepID=S4UK92_CONRT|nr:A-conotoxin peptide precursor Fla1.2 [Conus flavidus]AGK23183.1 A superfamily conotoxin Rt1.1 precursor [Conus rattus]